MGKSLASVVSIRGSYGLTADGTTIRSSWPLEVRAVDGRLKITATIPLEEYVAGVLAGEAGGIRSLEALKAMAVVVRTYAVHFLGRHSPRGYDFCDTTHCQDLRVSAISQRGRDAAGATEGELLWFQGATAATYYHRSCGGHLEDGHSFAGMSASPPYLQARQDMYCLRRGPDEWQSEISKSELQRALAAAGIGTTRTLRTVVVLARTPGGRATTVRLTGETSLDLPATKFRLAVGRALGWDRIRSDAYQITDRGDTLVFFGRGQGHGVGLCQAGAAVMAEAGQNYADILRYYFPGTTLGVTAQGLRWTSLADERVELLTVNPGADRPALTAAARALRDAEEQTGWRMEVRPQLRVFPSVTAFRDATGEPGWVAASTRGRIIRLQPTNVLERKGVLDATLRHELLHVLLEAHAKQGLPLWFREGVVLWLAEPNHPSHSVVPPEQIERRLNRPASEQELRHGYAASRARVAQLVKRFGKDAVLGWVQHGLPSDSGVLQ